MDNDTLDNFIDQIKNEKFILILGPDVCLEDSGKTINNQIQELLENTLSDKIKNYFSDDEFFSFTKPLFENMAANKIKTFFKNQQPREIIKKIAEIPFHAIISISPDQLLRDVFVNSSYNCTYKYYNKAGGNEDLNMPPTGENPLIFNLLGDIDEFKSLVYTYDHLFEFIQAIFGSQQLPSTIKKIFQDTSSNVLFLGFKFEKWYFKLMLRLLKNDKKEVPIMFGSGKVKSMQADLIKNFYMDEYDMTFIDDDETDIVNAIYDKCKELGILRGKSASVISDKPAVYISYAWGGDREKVVDDLYASLTDKAYNLIRDKQDLGYKGDILKFMDLIGTGVYIIVVISDKYLKSKNCMYEMQSISKNKDIQKRIFPIVLEDAKIYDPITRADYNIFWQNEKDALQKKYNEIQDKSYTGELLSDLNNYDDFRRIIDEITKMLSNMNTLTPEMHMGNNFSDLMKALDGQMQEDKSK